ncbi:unnamed protein product [Rhizoctonia solani]|uniref:ER-bound oxygenase mpaB/mpaB'/Rubber oxygenase catalytic domain-containing protein n=1 Tax=Rhizoctonia solani TaxID=456999 RepID=A0A8H3AKJ8_9AGAM|nr:unnamed protein product [Rhizoctonia solani]
MVLHLQPLEMSSLTLYGILGSIAYLTVVHILRYRRISSTVRKHTENYPPLQDGKNPCDYRGMTPAEAQKIIWVSSLYDFPFLVEKSLEFALFKTYGIESISKLLLKTGQLSKELNASRRYVDTAILIQTWVHVPITGPGSGLEELPKGADPRGAIALARTNWLHSKYTISNEEYLYTLSLFILEPARWVEKYEWRGFTPLERQAYFVFWSEIGRRMNIQNIPETLEDLVEWCEEYERANMVPSQTSKTVADLTTALLLYHVPSFALAFGKQAVAALCPERLNKAIMVPQPPSWVISSINVVLGLRKLFIRHLCLPRFTPQCYIPFDTTGLGTPGVCPAGVSVCPISGKQSLGGGPVYRLHPFYANNDPWYLPPPSALGRIGAGVLTALGLRNPRANPSPQFKPEGYRTEEIGPASFEKSGREAVRANAEAIYGGKISGPWAF